jgi:hypothetical protein
MTMPPGKPDPRPSAGRQDPRSSAGRQDPRSSAGKQDPRSSAGKQDPRSSAGKQDPRPSAGKQDPRPSAGKQDPRPSVGRQEAAVAHDVLSGVHGSTAEDPPRARHGHAESTAADPHIVLRVVCEAGSDILEATHQYVMALAKVRFRPTVAEKVSLACWELLSNALNFGSISGPVVFDLCQLKDAVELHVSNDAIAARCQMLDQRIQQLNADAKGTYLDEMRRSVTGGLPRAALGLARIAHEVRMELSVSIVLQSRVTVTARCPL